MPICSCGAPIDKLPVWLDRVEVSFRCSKCPGVVATAPTNSAAYAKDENDLEEDLVGVEETDDEDDEDEESEPE